MSVPQPPNSLSPKNLSQGLMVVGTQPKCGKTVACAGIVGSLRELGFKAQAIKPLSFAPAVSIRKGHDQAFFDHVSPPFDQPFEPIITESAHTLGNLDWQRLLDICRKRGYPYVMEAPGSLASPLRHGQGEAQNEVVDAVDLAQMLEIPLLIVTPKQPDPIAALAPVFAYLWVRDAQAAGWISVETAPTQAPISNWDMDLLYLRHHYKIPYLGEIAYSPSISVETLQQGNLLRTTESGVDLLPIQQALQLLIPNF